MGTEHTTEKFAKQTIEALIYLMLYDGHSPS